MGFNIYDYLNEFINNTKPKERLMWITALIDFLEELKDEKIDNYCFTCDKFFINKQAFEKHLNSKKHKEAIIKNRGKGILN